MEAQIQTELYCDWERKVYKGQISGTLLEKLQYIIKNFSLGLPNFHILPLLYNRCQKTPYTMSNSTCRRKTCHDWIWKHFSPSPPLSLSPYRGISQNSHHGDTFPPSTQTAKRCVLTSLKRHYLSMCWVSEAGRKLQMSTCLVGFILLQMANGRMHIIIIIHYLMSSTTRWGSASDTLGSCNHNPVVPW